MQQAARHDPLYNPGMIFDILGRGFSFASPPERVVSLVPSLTETLFDLGAGDALVGVTTFCLFPAEELACVARVGGTKNPHVEEIRALGPDLVYVNVEENIRKHADEIETFAPVFATEPKSVRDVAELIEDLGEIHGKQQRAAAMIEDIYAEVALAAQSARFTFACPIWKNPWMWCGGDTYVSNLLMTAGGSNVLDTHSRYPTIELEEVIAMNPDVIFLPDEPFEFTAEDAAALRELTPARVVGPFPGHLFTWHGSRTLKGLRFLRETMKPVTV